MEFSKKQLCNILYNHQHFSEALDECISTIEDDLRRKFSEEGRRNFSPELSNLKNNIRKHSEKLTKTNRTFNRIMEEMKIDDEAKISIHNGWFLAEKEQQTEEIKTKSVKTQISQRKRGRPEVEGETSELPRWNKQRRIFLLFLLKG